MLDLIASGKDPESAWSFLASGHAIERVAALGDLSAIALLKFVRKWAVKPEFDGDRPQRKVAELPMQTPTVHALMKVCESSCHAREAELLLRDIVRRSIKVNADRKLWGIIPVWAARCLFRLFEGYPEPKTKDSTNELLNRDEFIKKR